MTRNRKCPVCGEKDFNDGYETHVEFCKEMKRRDRRGTIINAIGLVGVLFILLSLINLAVVDPIIYFTTGYEYQNRIGSHFDNAMDATDFETMKAEILIAEANLRTDGVTNDSYCCVVFRTPHDKMDYWYAQLDNIVMRIEAAIFYFGNLTPNATIQTGDSYGDRLANLRIDLVRMFDPECSDSVAGHDYFKHAWYIENHIVRHVFVWWTWWIALLVGVLFLCAFGVATWIKDIVCG